MNKPTPKGGCAGVLVVLGIGALIGTNCTWKAKQEVAPEPPVVETVTVDPAPAVFPPPDWLPRPTVQIKPEPKPINPRETSTAELLKIFSAWQHDKEAPRTPEIQAIYEELLTRPEVEWHNGIGSVRLESSGKRRWRRR